MDLATLLAQHANAPGPTGPDGHPADGHPAAAPPTDIARGLDDLLREVSAQVASCVAVTILLTVPAGRVTVGLHPHGGTGPAGRGGPALASLAVPLPGAGLAALLVLQAADAGAFLLLAEDLGSRLGPGRSTAVDQHLDLLVDTTGTALAGSLADLRTTEQAVGALIEQGCPPQAAHRRLREQARAEHCAVPDLARRILAGLRGPPSGSGT